MPLSSTFGLDATLQKQFREIGHAFNPAIVKLSRDLFEDRKDLSLPVGGERHNAISYGSHERQTLDICTSGGEHACPVVVFFPGGGMVGGDKAFYANIPAFFARQGFIGVSANYRLAPEFLFPAGAQDVAAVVDWLVENVARFGGDPSRICIVAQSAGAVHAASAVFDQRVRARHHDAIRAAVLISGVYEVTPDHEDSNINLYFGNDAEELKDRSSCNHVHESSVPAILVVAELEPAFFGSSAAALMHALSRRDGHAPEIVWMKGHNHLSPVLNLGAPGDEFGPAIADALRDYL